VIRQLVREAVKRTKKGLIAQDNRENVPLAARFPIALAKFSRLPGQAGGM
jgi:hypothetical protein